MKFIDEIVLRIQSGKGGSGCVSFAHNYRNPKGGPDGGNGGNGGSVYFQGNEQINSFFPLMAKKNWMAENGVSGQSQLKTGRNGRDIYIQVPLGTIIKLDNTKKNWHEPQQELVIGEILFSQQACLVAKGGKGGLGNAAFVSSVNRSPRYAQKGLLGERIKLKLELKILADVGLIGLPNVGKSTLINCLTNTKVKTANFPFTTLNPQLGVLEKGKQKTTIADLPGIIEGAAQGKGLGLKFLRHIMRCYLIVYVLDASQSNSFQTLEILQKEIKESRLSESADKPRIIIWNKIDLLSEKQKEELSKKALIWLKQETCFFCSALQKISLETLVQKIFELVEQRKKDGIISLSPIHKIYDFTVPLDWQLSPLKPHCWKLTGSSIDNLIQKYKISEQEELIKKLKKLPLEDYLRQKGVENKDVLIINDQEFFWQYE